MKIINYKRQLAKMLILVMTILSIPTQPIWGNSDMYSQRLWDDEIVLKDTVEAGDLDEIDIEISHTVSPDGEKAIVTVEDFHLNEGEENPVRKITNVEIFEGQNLKNGTYGDGIWKFDVTENKTYFFVIYYEKQDKKIISQGTSSNGRKLIATSSSVTTPKATASNATTSNAEKAVIVEYEITNLMPKPMLMRVDDVAIDADNFEDENFRTYVKQFDRDNNGILSYDELAAVTEIELKAYPAGSGYIEYKSAKGIEFFFNLKSYKADAARFKTLDLNQNTLLEKVDCGMTWFEDDLDVSQLTNLKELSVQNIGTGPGMIDLSNNEKLEKLFWSDSHTTSMDLSNNKELKELRIIGNSLTDLNVKENAKLKDVLLDCYSLESLDLSGSPLLLALSCCGRVKESFPDIPGFPSYEQYKLKTLKLHPEAQLHTLYCNDTKLEKLQINTDMLLHFDCSYSELKELVMTDRNMEWPLVVFDVSGNRLPYLDLEGVRSVYDFRGTRQQNVSAYYLKHPSREVWYVDMKQLVGEERVERVEIVNTPEIESYNRRTGILTLSDLPADGIVRYQYDIKSNPSAQRRMVVDVELKPATVPAVQGNNLVLYEGENYNREDLHLQVSQDGYAALALTVDDTHVDTSKPGTYQIKTSGIILEDISVENYFYVQVVGKTKFVSTPNLHVRKDFQLTSAQLTENVSAVYEAPLAIPTHPWEDGKKINNGEPIQTKAVAITVQDRVSTDTIQRTAVRYTAPGMIPGRETEGAADAQCYVYIHGLPIVIAYDNGLATNKSTGAAEIEKVVATGNGTNKQEAASAYVEYVQPDGSVKKVDISPNNITYRVAHYRPLTAGDYYVTVRVNDSSVLHESQWAGMVSQWGEKQVKIVVADKKSSGGSSADGGDSERGDDSTGGETIIVPPLNPSTEKEENFEEQKNISNIENEQSPTGKFPNSDTEVPVLNSLPKAGDITADSPKVVEYFAAWMGEVLRQSKEDQLQGNEKGRNKNLFGRDTGGSKCILHIILFVIAVIESLYYLLRRREDNQRLEELRKQMEEEEQYV